MRALVQRVSEASVTVDGAEVARIGPGLLVLLGVRRGDGEADQADRIAAKLLALRVFEDADGKMNLSVRDVERRAPRASASSRSTATPARATARASWTPRRPRRPSRSTSACGPPPAPQGGVFGARMAVALVNDGPVTVLLEA